MAVVVEEPVGMAARSAVVGEGTFMDDEEGLPPSRVQPEASFGGAATRITALRFARVSWAQRSSGDQCCCSGSLLRRSVKACASFGLVLALAVRGPVVAIFWDTRRGGAFLGDVVRLRATDIMMTMMT